MDDHIRNPRLKKRGCEGTQALIKSGKIITKKASNLRLDGAYVIGASSVDRVEGLERALALRVFVRSPDGIVWEGEQCVIGKDACSTSKYAKVISLNPGKYLLDVELLDETPGFELEVCVGLVPVEGGLLISGAKPSGKPRMSPASGSTRSRSLMVGEPVKVGRVCVQRLWLWFFEPHAFRGRDIVARLERNGDVVYSISTKLFRVGIYSEIVIDVLTQRKGDKIVFLDPADLTRPLFITHTEGCDNDY